MIAKIQYRFQEGRLRLRSNPICPSSTIQVTSSSKTHFLDFATDNSESLQLWPVKSAPCTPQSRRECLLDDINASLCTDSPETENAISFQHSQVVSSQYTSSATTLQLAKLFEPSACNVETPTPGSANHFSGMCKPCSFFWKSTGCSNGANCVFCHLCGPDEKKRRQKEKKMRFRAQGGGM